MNTFGISPKLVFLMQFNVRLVLQFTWEFLHLPKEAEFMLLHCGW